MHTYDIALPGGINVRVQSTEPVFDGENARLLLGAYLPGAVIAPFDGPGIVNLSIVFRQADRQFPPGLTVQKDKIVLTDLIQGDGSLLDLIHLIYSTARLRWIRQGLYPVHCACVGDEQKGYTLVVGHSGAGKTALALNLAGRGGKIFAGNKTLIQIDQWGLVTAVAGTRTITHVGNDGKSAQRHGRNASADLAYQGRLAFELAAGQYAVPASVPVRLIALVRLNDGAEQYTRLKGLSTVHSLYPFFADAVNADTVLCRGKEVFAGSVSAVQKRRLCLALLKVANATPVISLTGSMSFVTTSVEASHD